MNFDPRLVQRLTRPLKRPGVTNHRMAEGLLERFQALENRLPLLDQQLSRWATTVEFDGGEVPIVYAQVSELDDQEVNNFQESLVAVKKEVRSPVQKSLAKNTVKSPEMPVVQQEISANPITSVEKASVTAIATQTEQPLTQISDRPQISSIPRVQLVSNTQPQPLVIQPVSQSVIQSRHDNATPSVINAAPLISMVSDAPTDPLALEAIATPISTEFNSTPDARPLVEQEIASTPIASVEASVRAVKAIATQTEQPLTQISDRPQISSIPRVQLVSNTQPEISQPLVIQPVSQSVIQSRHDNATPSVINAAPLISMVSDAPTAPLELEEIATPITTEFDSASDARPLVQQEIASTPIASIETSVTAVKAIASSEQKLSFVQLPQNSGATPIDQGLLISSESLPKASILPIDLPTETAQNEQPVTQISDRPQIPTIPISNPPSTLSSDSLSFATNIPSEPSEHQLSPLQVQQINTVNAKHLDYPQTTVQVLSDTQPEVPQPLIIQPVSEGVIQARYDNAVPIIIPSEPVISTVNDAPTYPLALDEIALSSTEFNSTLDAMPLVEQEISSTPIDLVEASVTSVKAIATQNEQPLTQISDRPQISSIPTVQMVSNTQPEISQPLIIEPVSEGVIQARYDNAVPIIIPSEPVISKVNDALTYPLTLDAISTPITTELDSALDAMHLVQREISPTPIASVEASVTAVKAIASSEQKLSFVQLPQNSSATPIDQGLLISSESLPKASILPIDLPTETAQNEQPVTQISDRHQIPTIPISNPPSTLSSDSLSFATNIPSEPSEHQLSPLQVQQINTVNTKHLDYPQTTVQVLSDTQPEVPQPLIIQPISEGVIQARYDNAAPSMINGESLISTVSDAPTYPVLEQISFTPAIASSEQELSFVELPDSTPMAQGLPMPSDLSLPKTSILPIDLPTEAPQNKQILTQISDRPQIPSIPTTVEIVSNTQPEISQPLIIQPVSEGVIQARYDSAAPSMINAQPLISTVSDAPIYSLPMETAIAPIENVLNRDLTTPDTSITKLPLLDSLPEVVEIPWTSSEDPQNPMPMVNVTPITLSSPSIVANIPSLENSTFESPTPIKVRKIDAPTAHILPDSLDTQTIHSFQDRLVFTPSNPTPVNENKVVATPIINPKTKKFTDSALSNDPQNQVNFSPVRTQIVREKVSTSNYLPPLSMEAMEDFQNSQPILTSVNNNSGKSPPPQSPVLPTVQAIAEISEQIFEPLLLSRRSSNASASEIRENYPNQGQPNSRAIANSSNMITYPTTNSSTQTNISSQLSPPQSSTVTNRSNQDPNNSMRPQNIPEVKEANINMDLLVAQVERKIMKRLVVEGERRGKRKWL